MDYLAHTDEVVQESGGLFYSFQHLPTWSAILVVAFVLFGLYMLLEKFKVNLVNRILILLPLMILIGIFYLQENTFVTTVVLSLGFAAAFFLAFMMLAGKPDKKPKEESKDVGKS